MRVLAVDPGLTRCGVGVVQGRPGRRLSLVDVGVIRTPSNDPTPRRLVALEDELRRWFDQHRPDVVLAANAHQVTQLIAPALPARARAGTAFVCLDHEAAHRVSGIDQLFETVGSHALDALVAQLHRNERGLPTKPTVTMVEGQWFDTCGFYPFAPPDRARTKRA